MALFLKSHLLRNLTVMDGRDAYEFCELFFLQGFSSRFQIMAPLLLAINTAFYMSEQMLFEHLPTLQCSEKGTQLKSPFMIICFLYIHCEGTNVALFIILWHSIHIETRRFEQRRLSSNEDL